MIIVPNLPLYGIRDDGENEEDDILEMLKDFFITEDTVLAPKTIMR